MFPVSLHKFLLSLSFFETESCYVTQASLELLVILFLSLPSTAITGRCHHTELSLSFFTNPFAFICWPWGLNPGEPPYSVGIT